ncbi:hypothetical protein CR152_23555 [Massilia violaceinigra]|uniref:Uncharacterized protein n=2 Tax=Massilia violaceinigra TaxID=2045208 RepID=A0A2D2DQA4_9BURK|nr:hypothetical protein CR152_23555 [Massilia violaceinigra]
MRSGPDRRTTREVDFADNRPAAAAQRSLRETIGHSQRVLQQKARMDAIRDSASTVAQRHPVQRVIIGHATIAGLAVDMDTSDYDASILQIDTMWSGGKISGLRFLSVRLRNAAHEAHSDNNDGLADYIDGLLERQASDDPDAGLSGWWATRSFDQRHVAADQTGVTKQPGRGEIAPEHPTDLQRNALNVRSWQVGDVIDMVSWIGRSSCASRRPILGNCQPIT